MNNNIYLKSKEAKRSITLETIIFINKMDFFGKIMTDNKLIIIKLSQLLKENYFHK